MSEIKFTCSLGGMCHSSQILKRNRLKICSYPFDWIFTNCDNIMHCIEDNFTIFLDKSYYQDIHRKWNNNQCGHKYYHENMFNHFDPRNEKDYNYYVRCVDRFKNLLTEQGHKLFVMMFINNETIDNTIVNKLIEFNSNLSKHTHNYTLLVIIHIPKQQHNYHKFTYNDNVHYM